MQIVCAWLQLCCSIRINVVSVVCLFSDCVVQCLQSRRFLWVVPISHLEVSILSISSYCPCNLFFAASDDFHRYCHFSPFSLLFSRLLCLFFFFFSFQFFSHLLYFHFHCSSLISARLCHWDSLFGCRTYRRHGVLCLPAVGACHVGVSAAPPHSGRAPPSLALLILSRV